MFHHLTNEQLDSMNLTTEQRYNYENKISEEIVNLTISKNKFYKNKKQIVPNSRCSCGRLAGFGIDVDGCLFLQYCCDGSIPSWNH